MPRFNNTYYELRQITLVDEPSRCYELTKSSSIMNGVESEISIDVCRPGESDYFVYEDNYVFVRCNDSLLILFANIPRKELTQAHRDNLLFNISAECEECRSVSYHSCSRCYPKLALMENITFHINDLPRLLESAQEAGYWMIEEKDEDILSTPQLISAH